jgi:hypothetical protein
MRSWLSYIFVLCTLSACDSTNPRLKIQRVPSPVLERQQNKEEIYPEVELRAKNSIAIRAIILNGLVHVTNNLIDADTLIRYLKKYSLWGNVSAQEKKFLQNHNPTAEEINSLSWRIECLNVILWSLNKIDSMPAPSERCGYEILDAIPSFTEDPTYWIDKSTLRSDKEISSLSKLTYEIHWNVRNAESKDLPIPKNYHPLIVEERHYALNWITLYAKNWDDITTDT